MSATQYYWAHFEITKVRLFVEGGGLKSERVDNVIDFSLSVLESLVLIVSRGIGTCDGIGKWNECSGEAK